MRHVPLFIAALLLSSTAQAQSYSCTILQHWRNAAMNGQYVPEDAGVSDTNNVITLNLQTGFIQYGNLKPEQGKPVVNTGGNTVGLLAGSNVELTVYTIFPNITDPRGAALGSIMRINDNMYMPKGTMMSRLSCKPL
ncbi:hypothetical protein [Hyphomicrobium sp.]|uniref:hypothetical protein n=1 Tax=Hyphomicrobium sp. TaxID=82 RepID=UPI002E30D312|nr:hypothetical protein [Hyphomicrobium sp.]HEX2842123.1 hypothetical protein [Hyphomicrobium sp.]